MNKPSALRFHKVPMLIVLAWLMLPVFSIKADEQSCTTGVVNSNAGPVCGKHVTTTSGKQANAYLGIPYAQSTSSEKRWQPPQPKQPWTTLLQANQFGPICPQYVNETTKNHFKNVLQSEDCLSLNIWTPTELKPGSSLPVMVFIYGGEFSAGSSANPLYDGSYLAANKDVILVSFNYRIGVLGFLATDEITGNYGFMDQQLALSWVQDNIQAFGGDPQKVTLFGQSAGAMSIGLHVFSAPSSDRLFRAAIMESNFYSLPYKQLEEQINVGNIFKQGLNCHDLNCMKNTSVDDLLIAQDAFVPKMSTVFSGAQYYIPFTPLIDGQLLVRQPLVASAEARFNKPLLLGTNKNEAVLFVAGRSMETGDYSAWAANLFGLEFQKVMANYPVQDNQLDSAEWARLQTDNFLRCSTRFVATNAKAPVYAYLFNHQPSFKVWGGSDCYTDDNVCHGAELPFVFHNANKRGSQFTDKEVALSNSIIDYWTNFAKYLNPNGDDGTSSARIHWPKFNRTKKDFLVLNAPVMSVQTDPYKAVCDFWDGIGYDLTNPWDSLSNSSHKQSAWMPYR